jgi:hypothetical protein
MHRLRFEPQTSRNTHETAILPLHQATLKVNCSFPSMYLLFYFLFLYFPTNSNVITVDHNHHHHNNKDSGRVKTRLELFFRYVHPPHCFSTPLTSTETAAAAAMAGLETHRVSSPRYFFFHSFFYSINSSIHRAQQHRTTTTKNSKQGGLETRHVSSPRYVSFCSLFHSTDETYLQVCHRRLTTPNAHPRRPTKPSARPRRPTTPNDTQRHPTKPDDT